MAALARAGLGLMLLVALTGCDFSEPTIYDSGVAADGSSSDAEVGADAGVLDAAPLVGPVMIAGGSFLMGCALALDCPASDGPPTRISVGGFWIEDHEATIGEYRRLCSPASKCSTGFSGLGGPRTTGGGCNWTAQASSREGYPLNCITWDEAQAYCIAAGMRLPKEAEWEFAARGGSLERRFPWGDMAGDCDHANYVCSSTPQDTQQVGLHPSGDTPMTALHDMAGNVAEWVLEDFQLYPNSTGVAMVGKVVRGGGYTQGAIGIHTTSRNAAAHDQDKKFIGVRCAKDH